MITVYCYKCKKKTNHYGNKCSICLSNQKQHLKDQFKELPIDEKLLYLYDEINKLKERNHNVLF
jgi:predicted amidophosphoribosyltransferase